MVYGPEWADLFLPYPQSAEPLLDGSRPEPINWLQLDRLLYSERLECYNPCLAANGSHTVVVSRCTPQGKESAGIPHQRRSAQRYQPPSSAAGFWDQHTFHNRKWPYYLTRGNSHLILASTPGGRRTALVRNPSSPG